MRGSVAVLVACSFTPGASSARQAVLVELFTAQGCVTCNNANAAVAKIIGRPDVTVLTWSVDYWDYLGWKDSFAQQSFSDRQRAYTTRFALRDVYTPQLVVGGTVQGAGDRDDGVLDLIGKARRVRVAPPAVVFQASGRVAVGSGPRPRGGGDVWLVRYDPQETVVEVKAGDNRGSSVSERNVVRQYLRIGRWMGRPMTYRLPPSADENLKTVVIVQAAQGGPVLACKPED